MSKSGGHLVKAQPLRSVPKENNSPGESVSQSGARGAASIALPAGPDLLGYEVAFYSVKSRRGGGVRVVFSSAVIHKGGKTSARRAPIVPLFRLPADERFVRVLHLARGSQGDHDAAILAASRRASLDALTQTVRKDPGDCQASQEAICTWIPAGVAVIPERRKSVGSHHEWAPAY